MYSVDKKRSSDMDIKDIMMNDNSILSVAGLELVRAVPEDEYNKDMDMVNNHLSYLDKYISYQEREFNGKLNQLEQQINSLHKTTTRNLIISILIPLPLYALAIKMLFG